MCGDADPFERALGGTPVRHVPEVLDIPVIERDIDRTELSIADKLFFLGTGWEILPIPEIGGERSPAHGDDPPQIIKPPCPDAIRIMSGVRGGGEGLGLNRTLAKKTGKGGEGGPIG